jgi:acyl-CoA synthetase (AMP-forming)/AMP-acid ligase II
MRERQLTHVPRGATIGALSSMLAETGRRIRVTDQGPTPCSLVELFRNAPSQRTAVIVPERNLRITYGEFRNQIEAVAESLASVGIRRGDRVALSLPNGLPAIVAFLAASTAGTAAPLNPAYKEEEFKFYLGDTNARVLLVPSDGAEEARRAAGDRVQIITVDMSDGGQVRLRDVSGRQSIDPPSIDDVALVLHTSGSTGRPKRVPLLHRNVSISAQNIARSYALAGDDVSLCVMPLFHVHGLVASTLATLTAGGTVVAPGKFNPLSFWRIARDFGATWYSAVPTIHQLLLARADSGGGRQAGVERLRFIRSCSAALAPQMMHDLEAAFGAPVLEAYGMTEAAHQMASNPLPPAERKPGSVGRGTNVRISIMDTDGRHLPAGERGEVVIQGPNVIRGYENNPEANASSFSDGWFRTGDQGYLDTEGYLTLVARIKELINRGGEKISPREIDEVLLAHPAIVEAVCFGVPHPAWGEEVAAAVVLRDPVSEADLLAYCRERLADYKRPKQIYITDAIPRTATGKIQRRLVAAAYSTTGS